MTNTEIIQAINAEIERLYNGEAPKHDQQCDFDDGYFVGIDVIAQFLDSLESEKPMNPDDAMKELDEKIALVKQRGTWDGVDVDKYMDEVRGREPEKPMQEGLEEEIERYLHSLGVGYGGWVDGMDDDDLRGIARHFAKWGAEHLKK